MRTGVFVLGMHRSGTSAATRLISYLGPHLPAADDLVQPSAKNPKGYWESLSLVSFNIRLLHALGSDERYPLALASGWERDSRLDALRDEAPAALQRAFPRSPWVWKDPRLCLTVAFWLGLLGHAPVVLVHRNPLEIVASTRRFRPEEHRVYVLALWERYLRQALQQLDGMPVHVTRYEDLLRDPLDWCSRVRHFFERCGLETREASPEEVHRFVDPSLRHTALRRDDLRRDPDVSPAQVVLADALEQLIGDHAAFDAPRLPAESATTEALLAERRSAARVRYELEQQLEAARASRLGARIRRARALRPLRAFVAAVRSRRQGIAG